mgnify:CR=1 FL=1
MSKIKIMFILIFAYIIYKGVVSIMNFEIGVSKKVAEIEKIYDGESFFVKSST